jgi:hypothetical protein
MRQLLILYVRNTYLQAQVFSDQRWSRIAPTMNAGVSKAATAIAVTGTILLWGNSSHNSAAAITNVANRLGLVLEPGWFETSTRLKMIYYGGVALLLAWCIYKLRCPTIIQRHR